ncbi:MAG: lipid-binding SYLF domain-containing protein [Gammaproteobacteria bacterium]|nr:lipid-binding SYLF domain-containing protein [Gammaproteobacteria bacterium]
MTRIFSALTTIALAIFSSAAAAATELDYRVDTATQILQDLRNLPENAVPPALLSRAYAVAVIPSVMKAGFIVGGTYGRGLIVARRDDGSWSNPSFVRLTQGSIGFQAGAQSTDLILVFKTRRALDGLARGKITLGGDASVAAGPVGRQATASTDLGMQSEIYSYARSRGFFAGLSVQGGVLAMDRGSNGAYYQGETSPSRILTDTSIPAPVSGRRFIDTLAAMVPPLSGVGATRAAAAAPSDMTMPAPESARTYGIDDGSGSAMPAEGPF